MQSVTRDRWLDERRWDEESNVGCGVKSAVSLSLALSTGGVLGSDESDEVGRGCCWEDLDEVGGGGLRG